MGFLLTTLIVPETICGDRSAFGPFTTSRRSMITGSRFEKEKKLKPSIVAPSVWKPRRFVRSWALGIVDSEMPAAYFAASRIRVAPTSSTSSCVMTVMLWGASISDVRIRLPEDSSTAS